jgi:branched-chain amino acid transport system ATP-binding protein
MALFEVKDLRAHYGGNEVIKGISFHGGEVDIISIIGANGAGKTTLLRCISHLMEISSGEIWFGGKRIDCLPPSEIVKMGLIQVPERRGLFSKMSVLENLLVGSYLAPAKEAKPRLEEAFCLFPILKERRNQSAGTLSGGEQQMLTIARGLMANPRLLMLDEPILGLSPLLIREIGRISLDISQRGVKIILAEQNARMALSISKRVYVIELGRIVLEGNSMELRDNEYVKRAYLGR